MYGKVALCRTLIIRILMLSFASRNNSSIKGRNILSKATKRAMFENHTTMLLGGSEIVLKIL